MKAANQDQDLPPPFLVFSINHGCESPASYQTENGTVFDWFKDEVTKRTCQTFPVPAEFILGGSFSEHTYQEAEYAASLIKSEKIKLVEQCQRQKGFYNHVAVFVTLTHHSGRCARTLLRFLDIRPETLHCLPFDGVYEWQTVSKFNWPNLPDKYAGRVAGELVRVLAYTEMGHLKDFGPIREVNWFDWKKVEGVQVHCK